MRGIGRGQTIRLLVPPEVAHLVQSELAAAAGGRAAELRPGDGERGLCDVAAWLLVNGMRSERVQVRRRGRGSVAGRVGARRACRACKGTTARGIHTRHDPWRGRSEPERVVPACCGRSRRLRAPPAARGAGGACSAAWRDRCSPRRGSRCDSDAARSRTHGAGRDEQASRAPGPAPGKAVSRPLAHAYRAPCTAGPVRGRGQADMLVCQNTAAVWRKRAYRELLRRSDEAGRPAGGGRGAGLGRLLAAWAENTDSGVPNRVPRPTSLREAVEGRVAEMRALGVLADAADADAVAAVVREHFGPAGAGGDGEGGGGMDPSVALEGEQVQEQEEEQVPVPLLLTRVCIHVPESERERERARKREKKKGRESVIE